MADEVIINAGRHGTQAGATLALGDVVKVDAAGKWVKTAAGDEGWLVALADAVADDYISGVKERVMKVKVDGGTSVVSIGSVLYVGDGFLSASDATATRKPARAQALEAASTDSLILVLVE